MAACVIATGWFPLLSIKALPSQNYNEGWNAYRQWMTLEGQPLYGTRSAFWTTNYGFLSFHIVGLLGGAKGSVLLAGRIVSFASLIVVSWLVGAIIRDTTGSRAGAFYAGLALFAGLCSFDGQGRGVNDPELLSAAFATFGLFAYMKAPKSLLWPVVAGVAFCFSLFTKHDYVAFPLSVGAHLIWTRNWQVLVAFMTAGFFSAGGLLALSFWIDGPYTLAELLQPRAYSLPSLLYETFHYLLHFAALLVVGVLVLWRGYGIEGRTFLLILLLFSNVFAIVFAGGDGVANNIFYPPMIADLLACVTGICLLERQGARSFKAALVWSTLGLMVTVPSRLYNDIQAMLHLPASTIAAQQAIAVLKASKGPAICEDLLLCYEAGKPMDYDPYYVKDQILIGHVRDASIVAILNTHHYGVIQLRGDLHGAWLSRMHLRFTPSFQRAFLAAYRPALISRFYVVFVPLDGRQRPVSNAGDLGLP